MKIKNLEKFIRKIQKSFSKAGITTVIEKGLPPYDAYEIHSKFRDLTIKVAIICDEKMTAFYFIGTGFTTATLQFIRLILIHRSTSLKS